MADTRVRITETPRGHFFWRYSRRTKKYYVSETIEKIHADTVRNLRPAWSWPRDPWLRHVVSTVTCFRASRWFRDVKFRENAIEFFVQDERTNRLLNFLRLRRKKLLCWKIWKVHCIYRFINPEIEILQINVKYIIFNLKFQKLGKNRKLHIFWILLEKYFIFLSKLIVFQENLSKTLSIKKLISTKLHFILPNVCFSLTIDILRNKYIRKY